MRQEGGFGWLDDAPVTAAAVVAFEDRFDEFSQAGLLGLRRSGITA